MTVVVAKFGSLWRSGGVAAGREQLLELAKGDGLLWAACWQVFRLWSGPCRTCSSAPLSQGVVGVLDTGSIRRVGRAGLRLAAVCVTDYKHLRGRAAWWDVVAVRSGNTKEQ
ncbi:hypothetical protein HaLaN_05764 [Haematococcus lacustris]|uniref:Uncharacterized protein n=1 Tax=Haematococcus lacustris TaxID=44745 RepID=A0A699Z4T9_HAELA|nr:hypothetical protein HaLaN_05764 [Haematococcus lacustris]